MVDTRKEFKVRGSRFVNGEDGSTTKAHKKLKEQELPTEQINAEESRGAVTDFFSKWKAERATN